MLVAAQPMSLLNVHFDTGFSPCTYSKYPTRCNFSHDGMALRESVRSLATPYFRLTALRLKLYAPHQSTARTVFAVAVRRKPWQNSSCASATHFV